MPMRLLDRLRHHARSRPDAVAIRQIIPANAREVTWRELSEHVDRISAVLGQLLPAKSVVMLCAPNRPEFTATFFAALAGGFHIFPVATDIAAPELLSAGERAGAAAVIFIGQAQKAGITGFAHSRSFSACAADAVLHDRPPWPVRRFDGSGLLLLSSGTTGEPKIVRRTGPSLDAVAGQMVDAICFTSTDAVLAAVPLCHSYGMEHGLLAPTWAGSSVHLYDRFDLPAAAAELSRADVSIFPGVPFMFEMLAGDASGLAIAPLKLRRAYSAGGPLPRSLFNTFLERYSVPVAQLYGATEIGSVTFNDPSFDCFDPASVGRAMQGVAIRVFDPSVPNVGQPLPANEQGHVAIKADSMLAEYIDGDPPPFQDGYFLTGDLGQRDGTGALTITGRIKLLIDVAGRKVNPLEVERVLSSHPSVGECVVVPMRMSQTLSRLRAVVTPARAGETIDVAELRQFAKRQLSAYKVPRVIEVREMLARSAAGKILRQVIEAEGKT